MTDALRSDRPGEPPDRERDARIEQLLLSGLDHYFAGQHELAINVWTRVLFLDRGHARARAYIERARSALSEKQREGDELVHAGVAALHRGERAVARQLLTSAVERAPSDDEALALLHRLDRLEVGTGQIGSVDSARVAPAAGDPAVQADAPRVSARLAWVAAGVVAGVLVAALVGTYLWIVADPFELNSTHSNQPALAEDPLPAPPACELRLLRARDLFEKGRLLEAAAELDAGDPDQRHRRAMDDLRATIQRQLLAAGRQRSQPAPSTGQ